MCLLCHYIQCTMGGFLDSGDVRLYIDRYFDKKSRIIGNCFTCVHGYKKAHNLHQKTM